MIVMKENQDRNIQNVYRQIVEISKKYQVKKGKYQMYIAKGILPWYNENLKSLYCDFDLNQYCVKG